MKISTKIFISLLKSIILLIPIPAFVLVALGMESMYAIRNVTINYEEKMMNRIFSEISEDYEDVHMIMCNILNDTKIIGYLKQDTRGYYSEYEIYKELEKKVNQNAIISEIYIYFIKYDYVLSSISGNSSKTYHSKYYTNNYETWLSTVNNDETHYFLYNDGSGSNPNVLMSGIRSDGEFKAQIVIRLSDSYFEDKLDSIKFDDNDKIFLTTADRILSEIGELGLSDDELLSLAESIQMKTRINGSTYRLSRITKAYKGLRLTRLSKMTLFQYAGNWLWAFWFLGVLVFLIVISRIVYIVAQRSYSSIKKFFASLTEGEEIPELVDFSLIDAKISETVVEKNKLRAKLQQYEEEVRLLHLSQVYLYGGGEDSKELTEEADFGFTGNYFSSVCFVNSSEKGNRETQEIIETYIDESFKEYPHFIPFKRKNEQYFLINGSGIDNESFVDQITIKINKIVAELLSKENIALEYFISSPVESFADIHQTFYEVGLLRTDKEKNKEEEMEQDRLSFERIKEIIDENLADPNISVTSIAYKLEISPSYLSRFFKKNEKIGVLDYIHKKRIEKAKELLDSDKNIKIKEVSEQVGFYNLTTFIRVFKKNTGVTPGEYRE